MWLVTAALRRPITILVMVIVAMAELEARGILFFDGLHVALAG